MWHEIICAYNDKSISIPVCIPSVHLFRLPLGIMWSCICGFLWLYVWQQPNPAVVPFYEASVYWFCISSVIEILVQPVAVIGQILLFVEMKVRVNDVLWAIDEWGIMQLNQMRMETTLITQFVCTDGMLVRQNFSFQ